MLSSKAGYLGGAIAGFALGLLATVVITPQDSDDLLAQSSHWLALNMGSSVWLFGIVLLFWGANLSRLQRLLETGAEFDHPDFKHPEFKHVVQLDELSDVWIHLFIGIGVVWTAVGMRSALSTTLSAPEQLTEDAGAVLTLLVDGGILLALTTTIVGAIGGYLMRLFKTIFIGADLNAYYHGEERRELNSALSHLDRIEGHLRHLSNSPSERKNTGTRQETDTPFATDSLPDPGEPHHGETDSQCTS
jgi:hypothetical protein